MPKKCWILRAWIFLWFSCSTLWAAPALRFSVDAVDLPWMDDQGLPQSSVLTLEQTRDGYLWLGTLNGLVRFDGVRFSTFDESNTPALQSSRIIKLFEDSQENLWVGTENAGILLINPTGKVVSLGIGPGLREGRLMAACEDQAGGVWLYTANGQLYRYYNKQFDVWNIQPGLASKSRTLIADHSGLIWVGTDWSLSAFDPISATPSLPLPFKHQIPITTRLDSLQAAKQEGWWRFADGRVQRWAGDKLVRDLGAYPWPTNVEVYAACEDQQGNLFVGTYGDPHGDGVYWFDQTGQAHHIEELAKKSIASLALDHEGCLWVGTDGDGLYRVKRQVFEVFGDAQPPHPNLLSVVQSVCDDGHGGLWIGYNSELVVRAGATGYREYALRRPPAILAVRSVFVDRLRKVWAGTYNGGLFELQGETFQPDLGFDLVANPQVTAIHQDKGGRLWVGTEGGLARWDGEQWRTYGTLHGLSANSIRAMVDDAEGNLWVGTEGGGLNRMRLSDGEVTWFGKTNGLPGNSVSSLYLDAEGVLWVGTSGGLARFCRGKWTALTTREGLAGNSIRYIIEDGLGNLWIGSNAGIMRVLKRTLNDWANGLTQSLSIRSFGRLDGLPTRECTLGSQPGACRTADGKLWFPTTKGLVSLNPAELQTNTNPPPVVIEGIRVDGQWQNEAALRAPAPTAITIPAGKESLEIFYTSLNLSSPHKGRFKYRMEGFESTWTERPGAIRSVRYSRLPPDDYTFRVTACNEDGVWNPIGSTLAVTVLPPFWRTWWFITLTSLSLLALIVGSVHYVSTQKLQRQLAWMRQQEALEKERSRIARDLHDQLGANLTQVALLAEMAETDKDLPDEVESHARQISQTARETTHSLDEIVWTVNPSNDTLDGLINYLCKYAQEYLAIANLRYRIEVPPQLPATPISPELRHNVFLAAKEAVNNIVKHAQASSAWVRLQLETERFTLEIADDGRGLPADPLNKGRNGLRNMRKRMEEVGGAFSAASAPEGGTLIRLTAPLHNGANR